MPLFASADPAGASLIDPANTGALPSATYNRSAPSEGLPLARLLQSLQEPGSLLPEPRKFVTKFDQMLGGVDVQS
jgi:hypothetical protein